MSEQLVTIEATKRVLVGKGSNHKLRKNGKIPAVFYQKGQSHLLELDPKLLPKAWANGKKFQLLLNGAAQVVKIQELQVDPVRRLALHVDLMPVD